MLGPQGTFFFLLLVLLFAGLMVWLILTKQVVLRVVASVLAFVPAMVFGIAAVNKYYDYYQSWGALFSDLSGQSAQSIPQVSAASLGKDTGKSVSSLLAASTNATLDAQTGYLFRTVITGPQSHITREVYVYLPPQYFSKAYANYRFPAIELLHGSPGNPETWVNVMNVIPMYLQELESHQAQPAVLVMPDTDGGLKYGLQCLNDPGGLQDMTFVGKEVPNWITANLRVEQPGQLWGLGGYSEGGFCAANIALQYPTRFGFAGSLSGYFTPITSQVPTHGKPGNPPVDINVFAHRPGLMALNSPQKYILRIPIGIQVPQFFLAAGALDTGDVQGAEYFRQLLLTRVASVPLEVVPGGGHQAMVWRTSLHAMLGWMTNQLAILEQRFIANQERVAASEPKAARHAKRPVAALPAPPLLRHAPAETGLATLPSRPLHIPSARGLQRPGNRDCRGPVTCQRHSRSGGRLGA
ncbi:MAG TPA: alpha/beta hydrolase-fold protein [Trebonia sp.]